MSTPKLALRSAFGLLVACALLVVAGGPAPSPSVAAPAPLPSYAADPAGGLPFDPPASTATPTPTVEPEYDILDYIKTYRAEWTCEGPFGTIGHRYLTDCNPFGYFSHPTNAYVDRYASPAEAQSAWQNRRDTICPTYPICFDTGLYGHPAYEAGNNATPYAHYEKYVWASVWLMGAVSTDDTMYRGAPPVADMLVLAARRTGYIGLGSHTPQPTQPATATSTATRTPTVWPTSTSGTIYDLTGEVYWTTSCEGPVLLMITRFTASSGATAGPSTMRIVNSLGQMRDVAVPALPANTSHSYACLVGECVPSDWTSRRPITLTVDVFNQVLESNEGNNTYVQTGIPIQATPCAVTPTVTSTPTPGVEPELAILQRVKDNHPTWNCVGPLGTPGHRRLESCLPTGVGHVASGYVDRYNSPAEAQAAWQYRRGTICPTFPLCVDSPYRGYQGYEAGNYNYPYAHHEHYLWGNVWLMGATSQDDTHFWSSPYLARAIIDAAIELGYLGQGSPTVTPSFTTTATPTSTPTSTQTGVPLPTCTVTFADVPTDNTFYPFVRCLACQGIVSGYPCGGVGEPCSPGNHSYFRPNSYVTRGQLAKIVSESAGFDEEVPPSQYTFTDVPYGSTFWVWVERLANREVMVGYPCGFDPNEPCDSGNRPYFRPNAGATRGQLTKIVSNAAGFSDAIPATQYTFTDVPPTHTFWLFVERLLANRPDVMSGYACGGAGEPCDTANRSYFRPNNPLTRGQTSKIVANTFFPGCNP